MWSKRAHPLAESSVYLRLTESVPSFCVGWKRTVRLVTSDRVSHWSPFPEARLRVSGIPEQAGCADGVQVRSGKCGSAVLGCSTQAGAVAPAGHGTPEGQRRLVLAFIVLRMKNFMKI
nr:uncharacterized protein LOC105495448 isoform X1 [Macaca nemestrina]